MENPAVPFNRNSCNTKKERHVSGSPNLLLRFLQMCLSKEQKDSSIKCLKTNYAILT